MTGWFLYYVLSILIAVFDEEDRFQQTLPEGNS